MRLVKVLLSVIMFTTAAPVIASDAGSVDTGGPIGEDGPSGFFLAVGDYYRVPQSEVIIIKQRGVPLYEIPVVLLIAKRTHVAPEYIMHVRLRGNAWLGATLRFGLGPEIFYVPVGAVVKDPPYGKVYGYYKHKPKKEWKTITLSDDDIINLVNLKWMSEHYGYPAEKIIKMRSGGKEFVLINAEIRREKGKNKGYRVNKDRPKFGALAY